MHAPHCDHHDHHGHGGHWAAGRHGGRGRFGGGPGFGGGRDHGFGGGDFGRVGRMLAQGDLRLLALALIAEQPRHGYEIIKVLEEKTAGWYAPSPGVVYPTLTWLEEAGWVTGETEGSKKLYTITEDGRGALAENKALVEAVLERLAAVGEKAERWRRRAERDETERGPRVSRLVDAAVDNLRDIAADRFRGDAEAEARIVEVLARAAAELRKI
ncbi:PadR family transcriptional regulator [Rhodoplanes sp. TEM]|uniref:PadR family transcriptional regulator n=1 Tax=Rhodoplanes tepidamans TaxID=200616 RepID=A0ABT5J5H4_RHOTP|nr:MULTISPECIES: PadR family transcriptional regulator [Rhodoplanes]MDC7784870.1 PadR family transcriptional regulator [Rhodoplanes tepidamans]MDC7986056.1 PadR family transcriptional regulator [Rhodoplanes sp. TEM]MDQ0353903.1 DNA-binding PadR family transcriptional regulator [Rhodoplanes tepidamans]